MSNKDTSDNQGVKRWRLQSPNPSSRRSFSNVLTLSWTWKSPQCWRGQSVNKTCMVFHVVLAIALIALVASLVLNVILFFLRWRDRQAAGLTDDVCHPMEQYREGDREHLQENPIYGNINPERPAAVQDSNLQHQTVYEHMKTQPQPVMETKFLQPVQPEVSYASLDLVGGKKGRKKHKTKQGQAQAKHPAHSSTQQEFLEVETEMEANLPSRHSSPLASRHSIYLNSQQMAMETQELQREQAWEWEREREREWDREWERNREWERERERVWDWEQERERERETDREREEKWQRDWEREAVQQMENNSGPDYDTVHEDPARLLRPSQSQD